MATKTKTDNPPAPPVIDSNDTDESRIAKYEKYSELTIAWQQRQPVIETEEELYAIEDLDEGPLFIPEWGRNVITRSLTRDEYNELDESCRQNDVLDTEKMGRQSLIIALVKPKLSPDAPIFKKNPMALKRIMDDILRKSGVLGEVAREVAARFQD
jgi:hypothetical protein